jgi:hypothetical protein
MVKKTQAIKKNKNYGKPEMSLFYQSYFPVKAHTCKGKQAKRYDNNILN